MGYEKSDLQILTGMWEGETKKGGDQFKATGVDAGKLIQAIKNVQNNDKVNLFMWRARKKDKPSSPDWLLYVSPHKSFGGDRHERRSAPRPDRDWDRGADQDPGDQDIPF